MRASSRYVTSSVELEEASAADLRASAITLAELRNKVLRGKDSVSHSVPRYLNGSDKGWISYISYSRFVVL